MTSYCDNISHGTIFILMSTTIISFLRLKLSSQAIAVQYIMRRSASFDTKNIESEGKY